MTPVTRHALGAAALLCTAVLAAACGKNSTNPGTSLGSTSPSAPASATPPATSPSPSAAPASATAAAGVAGCAPSALKAKVDTAQSGAAAGSVYVPVNFTNISSSSCTMFGYPGVSAVSTPSGAQLGRAATRNTAAAATLVTLVPGGVAHATIQVADAGNYSPSQCSPVTAHYLRIYPPNQFSAIYARYNVQVCSARLPHKLGSQLGVYVVQAGPGKAGQAP
jgi:Protein of unknown function (DUF4232)